MPTVENPKKPKKSPTIRQRRMLSLLVENAEKPKPDSVRTLALQAGYSESAANNPARAIFAAEGFQGLLKLIPDDEILASILEVMRGDDKRSTLQAADMLLKLKDRYPAGKLKLQGFADELAELAE